MSPTLSEQPVRQEEAEMLVPTDDVVTFYQLPPDAYNQYKQSGLDTLQRTPCRSRYMGAEVSQTDESAEAKLDKTTTSNVTKKGSHLRRSIQSSIGKLIHGSERRYAMRCILIVSMHLETIIDNNPAYRLNFLCC
jgi:kinesin family protein C2/C3